MPNKSDARLDRLFLKMLVAIANVSVLDYVVVGVGVHAKECGYFGFHGSNSPFALSINQESLPEIPNTFR